MRRSVPVPLSLDCPRGHGLAEPGDEPLPATAIWAPDTYADGEVWCRPRRSFDSVWRGTLIYVPFLGLELRRLRVLTLPGRLRFQKERVRRAYFFSSVKLNIYVFFRTECCLPSKRALDPHPGSKRHGQVHVNTQERGAARKH